MRKNLTKLASLVIIGSLLLGTAACGSSGSNSDKTTKNSSTTGNTDNTDNTENTDNTDGTSGVVEVNDAINLEGLPILAEKETIEIVTRVPDGQPANADRKFWQELEEKTNVHVEWTDLLESAWTERKNVMMASEDQPDAYMAGMFTDDELLVMGSGQSIIAIDGLISTYMPTLSNYLTENPAWREAITAADGKIYGVPNIMEVGGGHFSYGNTPYINQEWIEKVDISFDYNPEEPLTLEQFEELLIAFKDQDPNGDGLNNEIPWSPINVDSLYDWGASFGFMGNTTFIKDDQVEWSAMQEEFKTFVLWLNGLWEKGLLDTETFTQNGAIYNAKLKNAEDIIGYTSNWRVGATQYAEEDNRFAMAVPLQASDSQKAAWRKSYDFTFSRAGLVIPSSSEKAELVLRWTDNMLEPENSMTINSAQMIGEHLEKTDDGRYTQLRPIDWNRDGEYNLMPSTPSKIYIVTADVWNLQDTLPPVSIQKDPIEALFNEKYKPENIKHVPNTIWLTVEDAKEINIILTEITPYIASTFATWVTEGGIEEGWNDFISTMEGMGANQVTDIFQTYYDLIG